MAYVKNIEKNSPDSHQTSPAYVLTFTRWSNRDTLNYNGVDSITVRKPLVVVNDAVSINVENSKKDPSPSFVCNLKNGDLNYLTAIHPGDFCIVNMVNWDQKAMEIRGRALKGQPINKYEDGFKGLFKIIDVRMNLVVGNDGRKEYVVTVTGRGFDEFNTVLYYNPAIVDATKKANPAFFLSRFDENWKGLLQRKESSNVQNLVESIIKTTVGTGTRKMVKGSIPQNEIPRYIMPPQLGSLLNREKGKVNASDINNYYLGIWNPGTELKESNSRNVKPEIGFSGFFEEANNGNFFDTGSGMRLPGSRQLAVQDFQMVSVWSLLQNYSNTVLNEAYTTYRVAKDGFVYPTVIIRQKPFNNRHYKKNKVKADHTQFLDLPRWKISPDLITALSLGRSDSGRINFVQVFTRSLSIDNNFNQALQIQQKNYVSDDKDIQRSGMKPYIVACNYDYPTGTEPTSGRKWANLVADWVMNGHLKMNGSIQCVGIEDPISIGDNLDFDNTVYHIETVSHNMSVSPDGIKTFRTNISLSMGISKLSTQTLPVYAEMDHTDAHTKRLEDYDNERVLPGFSDTQDLPERTGGEEIGRTRQATFTNPQKKKKEKK